MLTFSQGQPPFEFLILSLMLRRPGRPQKPAAVAGPVPRHDAHMLRVQAKRAMISRPFSSPWHFRCAVATGKSLVPGDGIFRHCCNGCLGWTDFSARCAEDAWSCDASSRVRQVYRRF